MSTTNGRGIRHGDRVTWINTCGIRQCGTVLRDYDDLHVIVQVDYPPPLELKLALSRHILDVVECG